MNFEVPHPDADTHCQAHMSLCDDMISIRADSSVQFYLGVHVFRSIYIFPLHSPLILSFAIINIAI